MSSKQFFSFCLFGVFLGGVVLFFYQIIFREIWSGKTKRLLSELRF